jgi:hypothetical protein
VDLKQRIVSGQIIKLFFIKIFYLDRGSSYFWVNMVTIKCFSLSLKDFIACLDSLVGSEVLHGTPFAAHCSSKVFSLPKCNAVKVCSGNCGEAQCILLFGTRWKLVVDFTLCLLYPQGKSPQYPWNERLVGPHN